LVGEVVFIDKTSLEDAINFQDMEFEIIDGYYFNEGHNNTINNVIQHLYSKRQLKKKREPGTVSYKRNYE
jgi:predicted transcriptional regulator